MRLAREFGLIPDQQIPGPLNSITDVSGVQVGHKTLKQGDLHTGVTAVIPHPGNLFNEKVMAAVDVINGFGKSTGLIQIAELGTLETPILLTNTLSISPCINALIKRAFKDNPDIGRNTSTVNAVVCECNDGWLSDIQALAINESHAEEALQNACDITVVQGSVGAGTGMRCFGYKGGIGTSSRQLSIGGRKFNLGTLVLSNFGKAGSLVLPNGVRPSAPSSRQPDKGSIIVILATDIPLEQRQLHRVAKRCGAGIAQLGSYWGHGSGDIAIAFSTASRIPHKPTEAVLSISRLHDDFIDDVFEAAAQSTLESVLNSMLASPAVTGRDGHHAPSLSDYLEQHN